jgi:rhamnose transport system permease protein
MTRLRPFARWETLLVVLILASLWLGTSLSPDFLTSFSLYSGISTNVEHALIALPLTLVIITGEIDISIASTLGLASVVLGRLVLAGAPFAVAIAAALAVGILCGLVNGLAVTKIGIPSLVATLATMGLYRGLASIVIGQQSVSSFPSWFTSFGFQSVPGLSWLPWTAIVFIVLAALTYLVLHRSVVGRMLYAIGNNADAARFSAVPVDRLKLWSFVITGLVSALAGVIFTARVSSARYDNGLGWELAIVTAVLLGGVSIFGGKGSLGGVLLSLVLIGSLTTGLSLANVSSDVQQIVIGALLTASVIATNFGRQAAGRAASRRLAAEVARAGGQDPPLIEAAAREGAEPQVI